MKVNQAERDANSFRQIVELGLKEGLIPREQNVDVFCMITDEQGNLKTARGIVDGLQTLHECGV